MSESVSESVYEYVNECGLLFSYYRTVYSLREGVNTE